MATRNPARKPGEGTAVNIPWDLQGFSTIPSGAGFLNHQHYLCGGFKYFSNLFSSRMLGKIPVLTHMFSYGLKQLKPPTKY